MLGRLQGARGGSDLTLCPRGDLNPEEGPRASPGFRMEEWLWSSHHAGGVPWPRGPPRSEESGVGSSSRKNIHADGHFIFMHFHLRPLINFLSSMSLDHTNYLSRAHNELLLSSYLSTELGRRL